MTQRVIKVSSQSNFYALLSLGLLSKKTTEDIWIRLVDSPILIGIAATKEKQYDNYNPPCSNHLAVEIIYPSLNARLTNTDEEKLIKIFMFELAHFHQISFEFASFKISDNLDIEDLELEIRQSFDFKYHIPLKDYNLGMDLFINANQLLSADLKFLSYYKIFEYFAPVKSKIEAFDTMKLKLSSSKATAPDANFISSIFDLARNFDKSLRDNELIKTLIDSSFDLIDLYDLLPESIVKKLKQVELKYNSKQETKDRIINDLGNILYHTRNSIVHAKSNYDSKRLECPPEDLSQLNLFMHKASFSIIKWYSGLPEHLKINVG